MQKMLSCALPCGDVCACLILKQRVKPAECDNTLNDDDDNLIASTVWAKSLVCVNWHPLSQCFSTYYDSVGIKVCGWHYMNLQVFSFFLFICNVAFGRGGSFWLSFQNWNSRNVLELTENTTENKNCAHDKCLSFRDGVTSVPELHVWKCHSETHPSSLFGLQCSAVEPAWAANCSLTVYQMCVEI